METLIIYAYAIIVNIDIILTFQAP